MMRTDGLPVCVCVCVFCICARVYRVVQFHSQLLLLLCKHHHMGIMEELWRNIMYTRCRVKEGTFDSSMPYNMRETYIRTYVRLSLSLSVTCRCHVRHHLYMHVDHHREMRMGADGISSFPPPPPPPFHKYPTFPIQFMRWTSLPPRLGIGGPPPCLSRTGRSGGG